MKRKNKKNENDEYSILNINQKDDSIQWKSHDHISVSRTYNIEDIIPDDSCSYKKPKYSENSNKKNCDSSIVKDEDMILHENKGKVKNNFFFDDIFSNQESKGLFTETESPFKKNVTCKEIPFDFKDHSEKMNHNQYKAQQDTPTKPQDSTNFLNNNMEILMKKSESKIITECSIDYKDNLPLNDRRTDDSYLAGKPVTQNSVFDEKGGMKPHRVDANEGVKTVIGQNNISFRRYLESLKNNQDFANNAPENNTEKGIKVNRLNIGSCFAPQNENEHLFVEQSFTDNFDVVANNKDDIGVCFNDKASENEQMLAENEVIGLEKLTSVVENKTVSPKGIGTFFSKPGILHLDEQNVVVDKSSSHINNTTLMERLKENCRPVSVYVVNEAKEFEKINKNVFSHLEKEIESLRENNKLLKYDVNRLEKILSIKSHELEYEKLKNQVCNKDVSRDLYDRLSKNFLRLRNAFKEQIEEYESTIKEERKNVTNLAKEVKSLKAVVKGLTDKLRSLVEDEDSK